MCSPRSTLQLFQKHIKKDEEGNLDVSGILSKSCYEKWLSTRLQPPKNPAEAFRKTITAHCRGDSGMQAFSPAVEKAVLAMLREKKIWPCFEGTKTKIGQRGYQTSGYWETRKKQNVSQGIDTQSTKLAKSLKPSCEAFTLEPYKKDFNTDLPYFLSKVFIENEKLYGRTSMVEYEKPLQPSGNQEKHEETLSTKEVYEIINTINGLVSGSPKQDDIVKQAVNAVMHWTRKDLTHLWFLQVFRQTGFNIFYPKSPPLSLSTDNSMNYLFSRSFVMPQGIEKQFRTDRPVGLILGDADTMTSFELDQNCKDIYRGSILGTTAVKLRVNKVQSFLYVKEIMAEMERNGEVWARSIEHRCDGTVMVLLNRYFFQKGDPRGVFVAHQDVTDEFYQYL